MLRQFRDFATGPVRKRSYFMWDELGMLLHFTGRFSLRSLLQQGFVVSQRRFCSALSVLRSDIQQEADMIRNRAQIKRVLCVAEKNDAAKGIAEIMSNGRSRRVRLVSRLVVTCLVAILNLPVVEPISTLINRGWLNYQITNKLSFSFKPTV